MPAFSTDDGPALMRKIDELFTMIFAGFATAARMLQDEMDNDDG